MVFLTKEDELKLEMSIQVLYFYTPTMPFHNKILYVLSLLEGQYDNIKYWAIDANDFNRQCIRFSVLSVPTLLFLKDGREIKRLEGTVKRRDFMGTFADICSIKKPISGDKYE